VRGAGDAGRFGAGVDQRDRPPRDKMDALDAKTARAPWMFAAEAFA